MHLAIHHADSTKFSKPEYNAVRKSAEMVVENLVDLVGLDPHLARHADDPKLPTKTLVKSLFPTEFTQAILQLEVLRTVLHLCSGHWKAKIMINQAFLW
jgi:hypothetical protein